MDATNPEAFLNRHAKTEKFCPKNKASNSRGRCFGKLVVLSVDDLNTAKTRDYLLKGLISPADMSLWVGPPKCGKSFLLLYVAYRLSLGQPIFGRRVKAANVLYVAAEGEAGIANRIRALCDHHGKSTNFHFISQPADLLHQDGHLVDLIEAATAYGAQLIVLDTLSRLMAGGNENAPEDMGLFIRNVSHLRDTTKAHVAIVHHGTKTSGGMNPRGHSSLTGADDALIEVARRDDGVRTASVVHAKDDADGAQWAFSLDVIELGLDDDGDPVTTLWVNEAEVPTRQPDSARRLSNNEQIALVCFDKAMKAQSVLATVGDQDAERPVVRESDWRKWFYAEGKPGETPETKRQAFKRAIEGLLAKGRISCRDDFVWRPESWG